MYKRILNQFVPFFEDLLLSLLLPQWFREANLICLNLSWLDSLSHLPVHEFTCDQVILAAEVVVLHQPAV